MKMNISTGYNYANEIIFLILKQYTTEHATFQLSKCIISEGWQLKLKRRLLRFLFKLVVEHFETFYG